MMENLGNLGIWEIWGFGDLGLVYGIWLFRVGSRK